MCDFKDQPFSSVLVDPDVPCALSSALACLADVGDEIMEAKTQGLDFTNICK